MDRAHLLDARHSDHIRQQFPILDRMIDDKPLVYLDNASSAHKPQVVVDAMTNAMTRTYANVHRGLYTLASEATHAFEAARGKVQRFVGAGSVDEIVFTKSGTEAINLVAGSLAGDISAGDRILLSVMEHHSNIVPWHLLRQRHGAVLDWAPITSNGALDTQAAVELIGPQTRMIALTHMSNVLGSRIDIAPIISAARKYGAHVLLDGCQSAVHDRIDVRALGVDYFVLTGHKLYGPTGIGVLYGTAERLRQMQPYQGGGEMIDIVRTDRVTYIDPPHKFEAGTPPIVEAIGLGAAIDWLENQDRDAIIAHEQALLDYATARLETIPGIAIHGRALDKGGVISFSHRSAHPHDLAQILDRHGVAVRAGHHCAQPLMDVLGRSATLRISVAAYTNAGDIDIFIAGLDNAISMLT